MIAQRRERSPWRCRARRLAGAGLALMALSGSLPAAAVVIENRDQTAYLYIVDESEYHAEAFVAAGETTADLCNACFVVIVGVGKFIVSDPERIVIKNGKATVMPE